MKLDLSLYEKIKHFSSMIGFHFTYSFTIPSTLSVVVLIGQFFAKGNAIIHFTNINLFIVEK